MAKVEAALEILIFRKPKILLDFLTAQQWHRMSDREGHNVTALIKTGLRTTKA
jgi:hypothetical protein